MKKTLNILAILFLLIFAGGCKKDSDTNAPAQSGTGSADFSRFVTIGNSITAGYQSGALFETAQLNSYGNLIAQQVKTSFQQPLVADPGTGGRMEFQGLNASGDPIVILDLNSGSPKNLTYPAPYNNLGVPGAFTYDVLNATNSTNCFTAKYASTPNPMFDLILRNSSLNLGSQYKQAKATKATFVTLWIGNNDILGYATAGATGQYTSVNDFTGMYKLILDSLATLGAGVVVANIPDVTSIPFFTTIGPSLLKKGYPAYVWAVGGSGQTKLISLANNFITLKASALLTNPTTGQPTGIGMTQANPFPNAVVLDSAEVVTVQGVVNGYNAAISSLATAKGFAVVDINTMFTTFRKGDATGGTPVDGVVFKTDYITGGLFSLDGVHPSTRAQGIIANEFIKVINAKFGASIEPVIISALSPSFQKAVRLDYFGIPVFPQNAFSKLLF